MHIQGVLDCNIRLLQCKKKYKEEFISLVNALQWASNQNSLTASYVFKYAEGEYKQHSHKIARYLVDELYTLKLNSRLNFEQIMH